MIIQSGEALDLKRHEPSQFEGKSVLVLQRWFSSVAHGPSWGVEVKALADLYEKAYPLVAALANGRKIEDFLVKPH